MLAGLTIMLATVAPPPHNFVIPAFAMAEGPVAQDRELVEHQLREAGFDATVLDEARALTAIAARIVRTIAPDAFDALESFKAKTCERRMAERYPTAILYGLVPEVFVRADQGGGPAMAQGLTFDFEPRPVIEPIKSRQLWLLGGRERQAPNAATRAILREVLKQRSNTAVIVFPKADHGLIETVTTPHGTAIACSARPSDVTSDWITRGGLSGPQRFIVMPEAN